MMAQFKCAAMAAAIACSSASLAQDSEGSSGIVLGNGEKNWIKVDDVTRGKNSTYTEIRTSSDKQHVRRGDGTTLTFSEVHIEGDGWLVMHPFVDGKPSGTHVAGFAFVEDGTNTDVKITLNPAPAAGDAYVVMLHSDADNDRVFDFVFVAENVVEDVAVFEGNKMIAHIITVPQ